MIEINELATKISKILNGLDDETSSIFNPATSFIFDVKTYGTHLDSIADKTLGKNIIPVYISNFSGSVQPIPNLREENSSYDIYIYFPLIFKDTFFRMTNFLIDCFAGKMINIGQESGVSITNLSSPTLVDIQQAEFTSFQNFLSENYNLPIQRTELWGAMSFSLFFHQVANLGQEGGFIVGNQVKHEIAFTYDENEYKEELVVVSGARNLNSDTISEQRIYQLQTSGIAKNTSYIDSVQAYARDNAFWRKFIELYECGLLQNMVFDYKKIYNLSQRLSFSKKAYLSQCPTADALGEAKTFTFTFIKPIGSEQDVVDVEKKLRIPRTTATAYFEDFNVVLIPTIKKRVAVMEFIPCLSDPIIEAQTIWQDFGYLDVPTTQQLAKWEDMGKLNTLPTYEATALMQDFGSLKVPVTQQEAIWEGFGYLSRPTHESKAIYQTYGYLESGQIESQAIWQFYGELDIPTSTAKAIYQDFGYLDIPRHSEKFVIQFIGDLDLPKTESKAVFETFTQALPPIITDITISNIQKVSSLINFDSTSWEEKPTNAQGLYYQTKKTYSLSQVEGGTGNKNIQVKTGWEIDSNGDMHLHFFTRNKISQIGSSTWQGYMFGRKDTSTTFNDGSSSESANVIKTDFAWTSGATPTFYFQRPNETTQLKLDNRVVKSQNAYLLKNMELIPQGEMYYYDVNIGDVETTQNNVNFIVAITLYLANNELLNLSDSFTLYNNGEYN